MEKQMREIQGLSGRMIIDWSTAQAGNRIVRVYITAPYFSSVEGTVLESGLSVSFGKFWIDGMDMPLANWIAAFDSLKLDGQKVALRFSRNRVYKRVEIARIGGVYWIETHSHDDPNEEVVATFNAKQALEIIVQLQKVDDWIKGKT